MRKGREFEELIARMEKTVAGTPVKMTSPEYLTCKVTGDKREVDATLRYPTADGERVVGVECRDRAGAQDVTWIEQLVTKRDDLGLDLLIVVSRDGFTAGAIKKAAAKGIVLKGCDEVTADDLAAWTGRLDFKFHAAGWTDIELVVGVWDDLPLDPETFAEWVTERQHAVLFRTVEGPEISVDRAFARSLDLPAPPEVDATGRVRIPGLSTVDFTDSPGLMNLLNRIPDDGQIHEGNFTLEVPQGKLFIKGTQRQVRKIAIKGRFYRQTQSAPERGFSYGPLSGEQKRVVQLDLGSQVAQYEVPPEHGVVDGGGG